MSEAPLSASLDTVRRLIARKQRLEGKRPRQVTEESIVAVVRDLAYVQWDPVPIVAPSHLLSLWARLGSFEPALLERLLWEKRQVFEHWTPIASLVLTEDYPIYHSLMCRYPDSLSDSWGTQRERARQFLAAHSKLRRAVLTELRKGPLPLSQFKDHLRTKRSDGEWTPGSDVSNMLSHLSMTGEVMVVGHEGHQNLWGLTEDFLPAWADRVVLTEDEVDHRAALRALEALGIATPAEVNYYFVRGRYRDPRRTLRELEGEGAVHRVEVQGAAGREERYLLESDRPQLERIDSGDWEPRLTLLPPFDNLIFSSARTQRLFGFNYVREQFLPPGKRKFGTYVLPILWGERLIGRIDPRFDRDEGALVIQSVHAEPDAPRDAEVASALRDSISDLARFIGAEKVRYSSRVPPAWQRSLR